VEPDHVRRDREALADALHRLRVVLAAFEVALVRREADDAGAEARDEVRPAIVRAPGLVAEGDVRRLDEQLERAAADRPVPRRPEWLVVRSRAHAVLLHDAIEQAEERCGEARLPVGPTREACDERPHLRDVFAERASNLARLAASD